MEKSEKSTLNQLIDLYNELLKTPGVNPQYIADLQQTINTLRALQRTGMIRKTITGIQSFTMITVVISLMIIILTQDYMSNNATKCMFGTFAIALTASISDAFMNKMQKKQMNKYIHNREKINGLVYSQTKQKNDRTY